MNRQVPTNATGSGVWAAPTDAQIASIGTGGMYFNAHSAALPGGEIRGQIARNVRYASMSAAKAVPTNAVKAQVHGHALGQHLHRAGIHKLRDVAAQKSS